MDKIKTILYSLIIIFLLIISWFVISFWYEMERNLFLIVAGLGLLFLALGIALIILGRKKKGKLKVFLMLTGFSAVSPLIFTILHNLFYGVAITFESVSGFFEFLHASCFIIATIISPITFIIGVVGSLILVRKR